MSSPPDWPDTLTLIAGGLVLLAFALDALYQSLRFLLWMAQPEPDLAPFDTPGSPLYPSLPSPSHPTALDLFLGPDWVHYHCQESDNATRPR